MTRTAYQVCMTCQRELWAGVQVLGARSDP